MEKRNGSSSLLLFNFLLLLSFGIFFFLIKYIKQQKTSDTQMFNFYNKNEDFQSEVKTLPVQNQASKYQDLNPRQLMIMEQISIVGELTPKQLQKLIPDVSTRTIRRDMDVLCEKKLVSQRGSTKSTYYKYLNK